MYSRILGVLWGFDCAKEKFLLFRTGNDVISITIQFSSESPHSTNEKVRADPLDYLMCRLEYFYKCPEPEEDARWKYLIFK